MNERDPLPDCRESDWQDVPPHLREGLKAYLIDRVRPGAFLSAVLTNNLTDAVLRADPASLGSLKDLVLFLHNYAPANSHGSSELFEAWLAHGIEAPQ